MELKVPPVLLLLLSALAMWLISKVTTPVLLNQAARVIPAIFMLILSAFSGLAGVAAFRKAKTTVNPLTPEASSNLVQAGIFRRSRNPMYLSLLLAQLAWAIYLGNPWTLAPVAAFVFYIDRYQIRPEERALESAYGQAFLNYKSKVRKWL